MTMAAEAAEAAEAMDTSVAEEGFMAAIGRLGLGELDQEPKRLQETLDGIDSEMHDLSVKHYQVHLENARCLAAVRDSCAEGGRRIGSVKGSLDGLSSDLKRFRQVGQRLAEAHAKNIQTLDKHVQLLELLEIPQLMDTCARNNLYDEALDLSSYTSTLQKRHFAIASGVASSLQRRGSGAGLAPTDDEAEPARFVGGTAIINAIAADVNKSSEHMRGQLLQLLRHKITLPECLRYISYLRRLDAQERVRRSRDEPQQPQQPQQESDAPEVHLRFEFLDCRDAYIQSLSGDEASMQGLGPYQSSLRLIDRCRVNWFDVITQYKAIFAVQDNVLEGLDGDCGILARWVSGKMIDFLIALNKAIGSIDDFGALANVLEQAMKFGLSLARVGADFRPLLMEPFKARVFEVMADFWQQATERAEKQLADGEWGDPLPIPRSREDKALAVAAATSPAKEDGEAEDGDGDGGEVLREEPAVSLTPPNELLEFPVAAELVNVVLTSFNELRQCTSPIFAPELGQALAEQLGRLPAALQAFKAAPAGAEQGDAEGDAAPRQSAERFNQLCRLLATTMLPYLQLCFDSLFERKAFSSELRTFVPISPLQAKLLALVEATAAPAAPASQPASELASRPEDSAAEEGEAAATAAAAAAAAEEEEDRLVHAEEEATAEAEEPKAGDDSADADLVDDAGDGTAEQGNEDDGDEEGAGWGQNEDDELDL